ncbi:potassium-transporting ATPase subunit KdpC [Phenylobacterium immobile]|uniref:potassium-transporting ATPase subunit KdpC n=1 Tax=Phenylobacterium immobile TaxID=21 RepID=UPI000A75AF0D|nr:potassium-transporting ATPase subunit KdpC [Phenylobacterium immobile]
MLAQIRPALVVTLVFTLLLGVAYPLAVTGVGKLAFPAQAGGSLIHDQAGQVIGSALLGQNFSDAKYLHPRPSAAGSDGYDASASSGSNLGPLNPALIERIGKSASDLAGEGANPIPADALTTSGSGLDPDVSPANAARQAARIAAARGVSPAEVDRVLKGATTSPWLGVFGQARVTVLKANLALDAAFPAAQPPAQ